MTKKCTCCGEIKPHSEFYKCSRNKNGLQSRCKACDIKQAVEWSQKNKERYQRNQRRASWQRLYGISEEDYNNLLIKQEFKCAVCGVHQKDLSQSLSVDHDHTTGRVRGLLCSDCNFMLGHAKDNADTLTKGVTYLQRSNQ